MEPQQGRQTMERTIDIGDGIKVVDSHGVQHDALVSQHWGDGRKTLKEGEFMPTINVAFISSDSTKTDQYGRQIERDTSVPHKSNTDAPGRYWFFPDEGRK
jgi:hypothetical protein